MICKICGKNQFIGHQIIRADVLVDGDGEFAGNLSGGLEGHIYDSEKPYGPFTCICCGAEYDELTEDSYPVYFYEGNTLQSPGKILRCSDRMLRLEPKPKHVVAIGIVNEEGLLCLNMGSV